MSETENPSHSPAPCQQFALVKASKRKRVQRFPAGCVVPVGSEEEALRGVTADASQRAALVYGPSPSSEGVRVYYLVRWL